MQASLKGINPWLQPREGIRRFSCSAAAVSLTFGAASASSTETEPHFNSFGLGQESCRTYLSDIASDQSNEQLYSAWLAGFMTVMEAQVPGADLVPREAEMSAANAWIKNYCVRRASDTYLTATVQIAGGAGEKPVSRPCFDVHRPDAMGMGGRCGPW